MTNPRFEAATGFRAEVEDPVQSYVDRMRVRASEVNQTAVNVLLFGPGKSSNKHLRKRRQIQDHLRAINTANFVETGESIDQAVPELAATLNLRDREELVVAEADLIFVLLASERQATGPEAEILAYGRDRRTKAKTYVFLPSNWDKRGFLAQAVVDFPNDHKYWLTFDQIDECTMIRSYCEEKIREARGEKYMSRRRIDDLLRDGR